MRILTRYMLRAHVGPFVFALSVLTGLLFVNTVARRLPELAGKGLPASVFGQVMLLSLPHIVALTLPMAVLVAVLYAYGQLAADNEVTALKASGVNMLRLLVPVLVAATLLAAGMVWFNDRVLPETNHQLKTLMANINTKAPTLTLRPQVVNSIRTLDYRTRIFLKAGQIDHGSGNLKNVIIYDMSDPRYHRTVYADSGHLAFNQDTTDLFLTLYDGHMLEVDQQRRGVFQRVNFTRQVGVIDSVGNALDMTASDDYRSDRELTLAMLSERMDSARVELVETQAELAGQTDTAMARVLRGERTDLPLQAARPTSTGNPEDLDRMLYYGTSSTGDDVLDRAQGEIRALTNRAADLQKRINAYEVEYHKKYAIPFACIIFVLIGAPLAVRFPRGGAGMVIAISLAIFGVYYMSLIGGETLGDEGTIRAFIGPWAPNIGFGAIALFALTRIGKETSTTRGGDWEDLWRTTVAVLTRPFRRKRRHHAAAAGGAD